MVHQSPRNEGQGQSMSVTRTRPAVATLMMILAVFTLGGYFTFAAVQGDFGVFRQVELAAETRDLTDQRDALRSELTRMENLTHWPSDGFLDLDLLDAQARDVLGSMRGDEVVIR